MIKQKSEDLKIFDGKLNSIYRGVVEDNVDPLQSGRVRVRIFGLHAKSRKDEEFEGIPTDKLLWAQPALGLIEGSISGMGIWSVPVQGSHVFVFFENGNLMNPIYFASAPGIPKTFADATTREEEGFNDPDGIFPYPHRVGQPDYHTLSRGTKSPSLIDVEESQVVQNIPNVAGQADWNEPDPEFSAEYPHNLVLATHGGIVVEIDSTPEHQRVHLFHPAGTRIEIGENGTLTIRNNDNKFEITQMGRHKYVGGNEVEYTKANKATKIEGAERKEVGKDEELDVGGNWEVHIEGNTNIDVEGDISITGGNEIYVDAESDITVNSGSDISINSDGNVYINS